MGANNRGFTAMEFIAIVLVIAGGILLIAFLFTLRPTRTTQPRLSEQQVLLGIIQAFDVSVEFNDGIFLPSEIDLNSTTVSEHGSAKDTTANLVSLLIYNGLLPPTMLVSPAEVNRNIQEKMDYQYDEPDAAINPVLAMWDPSFSADFIGGEGNISYALMPPVGARRALWNTNRPADTVMLGNRGPHTWKTDNGLEWNTESQTMLIWGPTDRWRGFVAFGDGHVEQLSSPLIGDDHLFFDEPDRPTNAFLGIWTTAGETMDDHTFIWD